jgi:hypothetical protein
MKRILPLLILNIIIYSCKKENKYENDAELCELLSEMTSKDQEIRQMELLEIGTEKQKDSLWKIQKKVDNENTELLIEVTKKRGWVSKNGLNCEKNMAPVVIFRHSSEKYWNEIKLLIEKENKEGRMGNGDYMFIDNHLQGRPAFDFQIVE